MKSSLALSTGLSLIASRLLAGLAPLAVQRLLPEQAEPQLCDAYRRRWLHGPFIEAQAHTKRPDRRRNRPISTTAS